MWKLIEEGLPTDEQTVIVYDGKKVMPSIYYKDGNWFANIVRGTDAIDNITHWMKLPNAPYDGPKKILPNKGGKDLRKGFIWK